MIRFRPATLADHGHLVVSFSKTYKETSAYAEDTTPHQLGDLIRPLLLSWDTVVAHDDEDPDTVLGWICSRDAHTVAWLHVLPALRRKGLGAALLAHAEIDVSKPITTPFAPTRLRWLSKRVRLRFRPYCNE